MQLRGTMAATAERDASAALEPLQASGGLALVAVLLPLLQFLYFTIRILIWVTNGLQRLGVR